MNPDNPFRQPVGNGLFFGLWALAALMLAYPVLSAPKGEIELAINAGHHPAFDLSFRYLTYLGDGTMLAVLFVLGLLFSYRLSLLTVFLTLFLSAFMMLFKEWLFEGMPRPRGFFGDSVALHFVDGVDVYYKNTFPSGHTATAFAIAAMLAGLYGSGRPVFTVVLFVLAVLAGFSRVYLMQHFAVDVYFGAAVGLVSHWMARAGYYRAFRKRDARMSAGLLRRRSRENA
jgi:membrane-associated phospholipid phosphatase